MFLSPYRREYEQSRGRSRPRSRSPDRSRARSLGRSKSRPRSQSRSPKRNRAKSRGRSRSPDRSRARSRAKSQSRNRSHSPDRSRAKSQGRSKSRPRSRSKSRSRSRSRSRGRSRGRSYSKGTSYARSKSRQRSRSRSRSASSSSSSSSHSRGDATDLNKGFKELEMARRKKELEELLTLPTKSILKKRSSEDSPSMTTAEFLKMTIIVFLLQSTDSPQTQDGSMSRLADQLLHAVKGADPRMVASMLAELRSDPQMARRAGLDAEIKEILSLLGMTTPGPRTQEKVLDDIDDEERFLYDVTEEVLYGDYPQQKLVSVSNPAYPPGTEPLEEGERQALEEYEKIQDLLKTIGLDLGVAEITKMAARTKERLHGNKPPTKTPTRRRRYSSDSSDGSRRGRRSRSHSGSSSSTSRSRSHGRGEEKGEWSNTAAPPCQTPEPSGHPPHPGVPIPTYPPSQVPAMMHPSYPPPVYTQYGNYLPFVPQQWPPTYPPPNMGMPPPTGAEEYPPTLPYKQAYTPEPGVKGQSPFKELLSHLVLEEREKLKQEREIRMKKKEYLMKELERLRKQQGELLRKKRREKDGHKDPLLQEISHLQEEVMAQISNLRKEHEAAEKKRSEIEKVALILGLNPSDRPRRISKPPEVQKAEQQTPPQKKKREAERSPEGRPAATPPPEPFEYYDAGNHWCKNCNATCGSMFDFFTHLHSKTHLKTLDPYDRPWASTPSKMNKNQPPDEKLTKPAKGSEFLVPVRGFFCLLCREFYGDGICAEEHVTTHAHNEKYKKQMYENPLYEQRRNLDRQAGLALEASGKKRKHDDDEKDSKEEKSKHKKEKKEKEKKKEEDVSKEDKSKMKKEEDEDKLKPSKKEDLKSAKSPEKEAKLRKQSLEAGKPTTPATTTFGKFIWKKKENMLAKEAEKVAAEFIKEDEAAAKDKSPSVEDSFAKSVAVAKEIAEKLGNQPSVSAPWMSNRGRIRPNLPTPALGLRKPTLMGRPASLNTFLSIKPQNPTLVESLPTEGAVLTPPPLSSGNGLLQTKTVPYVDKLGPFEAPNSAPAGVTTPTLSKFNPAPTVFEPAPVQPNPAPAVSKPVPVNLKPVPVQAKPLTSSATTATPAQPAMIKIVSDVAAPGVPEGEQTRTVFVKPPPFMNKCDGAQKSDKFRSNLAAARAQDLFGIFYSSISQTGPSSFSKPASDSRAEGSSGSKSPFLVPKALTAQPQSKPHPESEPQTESQPQSKPQTQQHLELQPEPQPKAQGPTQFPLPNELQRSPQRSPNEHPQNPLTLTNSGIQIMSVWSLQSAKDSASELALPNERSTQMPQPRLSPPLQCEAQSAPEDQSVTAKLDPEIFPESQSSRLESQLKPCPESQIEPRQSELNRGNQFHPEAHSDTEPEPKPKTGPKTRGKKTPPAPRPTRQTRSQTRYQTRQQLNQNQPEPEPESASGDTDAATSDPKNLDMVDPGSTSQPEAEASSEANPQIMKITAETLGLPSDMTSLDFEYDFNFE
uniref:U1-type domain-containing protein n=1 Tax=Oreochromis aureus TaxID=47969 RepID=A0A668V2A8_OREAU